MATHSIGKLKFNLSGQGLAYRWGDDGEVHRLFQGKKQAGAEEDYLDEEQPAGDARRDDYDVDDDGYADDDYDDDEDEWDLPKESEADDADVQPEVTAE